MARVFDESTGEMVEVEEDVKPSWKSVALPKPKPKVITPSTGAGYRFTQAQRAQGGKNSKGVKKTGLTINTTERARKAAQALWKKGK